MRRHAFAIISALAVAALSGCEYHPITPSGPAPVAHQPGVAPDASRALPQGTLGRGGGPGEGRGVAPYAGSSSTDDPVPTPSSPEGDTQGTAGAQRRNEGAGSDPEAGIGRPGQRF